MTASRVPGTETSAKASGRESCRAVPSHWLESRLPHSLFFRRRRYSGMFDAVARLLFRTLPKHYSAAMAEEPHANVVRGCQCIYDLGARDGNRLRHRCIAAVFWEHSSPKKQGNGDEQITGRQRVPPTWSLTQPWLTTQIAPFTVAVTGLNPKTFKPCKVESCSGLAKMRGLQPRLHTTPTHSPGSALSPRRTRAKDAGFQTEATSERRQVVCESAGCARSIHKVEL
jgi:hypothetical protein